MKLLKVTIYISLILFGIYFTSCGNKSERKAPSLKGAWVVSSRVIEFDREAFDPTDIEALDALNDRFEYWIADGRIELAFDTLVTDSYREEIYEELNGALVLKRNFEGQYTQDYTNNILGVQYTNQNQLGTWKYQVDIKQLDQRFFILHQKMDKIALRNYWIIYGDGNRDFFETQEAEMVTIAFKLKK